MASRARRSSGVVIPDGTWRVVVRVDVHETRPVTGTGRWFVIVHAKTVCGHAEDVVYAVGAPGIPGESARRRARAFAEAVFAGDVVERDNIEGLADMVNDCYARMVAVTIADRAGSRPFRDYVWSPVPHAVTIDGGVRALTDEEIVTITALREVDDGHEVLRDWLEDRGLRRTRARHVVDDRDDDVDDVGDADTAGT